MATGNTFPIGDSGLINNRAEFLLQNGKKLGNYIPFYFGVRMPMLYVIQNGYNAVKVTAPQNIVYCVTTVAAIMQHQLSFVFTNGHAVDRLTDIFIKADIDKIESIIDFNAVKSQYWKSETDLDLKRRKEAEFLIENDVPTALIAGYIVYNEEAKAQLLRLGVIEKQVAVKKDFYF